MASLQVSTSPHKHFPGVLSGSAVLWDARGAVRRAEQHRFSALSAGALHGGSARGTAGAAELPLSAAAARDGGAVREGAVALEVPTLPPRER